MLFRPKRGNPEKRFFGGPAGFAAGAPCPAVTLVAVDAREISDPPRLDGGAAELAPPPPKNVRFFSGGAICCGGAQGCILWFVGVGGEWATTLSRLCASVWSGAAPLGWAEPRRPRSERRFSLSRISSVATLDSEAASGAMAPGWLKSCSLEPPTELRRPSVDCRESLSRMLEKMPEFLLGRSSSAAGMVPGAGRSLGPVPGAGLPWVEDRAGETGGFEMEFRAIGDAGC